MEIAVQPISFDKIKPWRDLYRAEMNCQIIHDSIHSRPGWTLEYGLSVSGILVGYGSVTVAGPWKGKPTVYEFFVAPPYRSRVFVLFPALLEASGAVAIETQSNDPSLTVMLHAFAPAVACESILFHDRVTTAHSPAGAVFRKAVPADQEQIDAHDLDQSAGWVVEVGGAVVAAGDILFHYNRPYGDIYMKVAEPFWQRGLGCYLVQELKRVCYEGGSVPAARCNPSNLASRATLQKAGFVPCGAILVGSLVGAECTPPG